MSKITVTTIAGATSGADANKVKIESGDELNVVNGDLTVNTNKLFVDASTDLIGIGTASPATATGGGIDIHRNGGSSVRIDDTTNSVTGELQVYSAGLNLATVTNHNLVLSTNNSAKMTIDGSGRVTMPSQPSFMVRGNNSAWVSVSSGSTAIIEFDGNVSHNVGNHYSTANDRFVAPIAGRYFFIVHAYVDTGGSSTDSGPYGFVRLRKNGSNIPGVNHIFGYANDEDHDQQCSFSSIRELAANDYIQVGLQAQNVAVRHYGDSSVFYGHLLS